MKRREFLMLSAATLVVAPGMARAGVFEDQIIERLESQGFHTISQTRTFLGRVRIVAVSATHRRELVLNPRIGVVLRDYWEKIDDDGGSPSGLFDDDQTSKPGEPGEDAEGSEDGAGEGAREDS